MIRQQLVHLRKAHRLTQEQLAEKLSVSRQAVAKWESGESQPEIEKLIGLSDQFSVPVDVLLRGKSDCYQGNQAPLNQTESLKRFLCRAKVATYAGSSGWISASRPKSHDLSYQEEELLYLDSYLGDEKFSGEEAIWLEGQPVWSMNYIGRVLSPNFSSSFLKQSLSLVNTQLPYRGPKLHQQGPLTYHCLVDGHFSWFMGHEEILYEGEKVYECRFHGGTVK